MYCTVLCFALLPFASSLLFDQQKKCPNNETYDLGPPWTTLTRLVPPPRCIEYPAKYLLSNRSNPTYPVVFSTDNYTEIQDYYSASKPTVIVFHGYLNSEDSSYVRNITGLYLAKVDANAIYVDYSNISINVDYLQSVSDLRVVARYVIKLVQTLIQLGTKPADIHLIGFSLGAHLAAYVAKVIRGIGRLTGLDPAGPAFTDQSCEVRLCKGDANFTEAIHVNGHPLIGFGTSQADADVNFWVNGGWDQPNCGITINPLFLLTLLQTRNVQDAFDNLPCSHVRAVLVYSDALACNSTMWGQKPDGFALWISRLLLGYPTKLIVNTKGCTLAKCAPIGLDTIKATGRGDFIVPTPWEQPFCVSQS